MEEKVKFIALEKIGDNKYKTKSNVILNIVKSPDGLKIVNWENSKVKGITSQPLSRCKISDLAGILCLSVDHRFYDNNKKNRKILAGIENELVVQYDFLLDEALKPDLLNL